MFDTQKNESTNNAIAYVATKTKNMVHRMNLNNRILYVVGISIFRFRKYWQRVFNSMKLNMSPIFKKFLQSETYNAEKNKS